MNSCFKFLASIVLVLSSSMPAAGGVVFYAIGDGGASLLRFRSDKPGVVHRIGQFNGADEFLDGIDFRPLTGELFGYRDATSSFYTVDLSTATLTSATSANVGARTNTFVLGLDFNPTIDRMRVVTESGQNIVYNPLTGTATEFVPLFYGAGDPNEGLEPLVVENAYTKNRAGLGLPTQQYVLDHGLNTLALLANNLGTLQTVGEVTLGGQVLDFDEFAGFDVLTTPSGVDSAFALLRVGGTSGLYSIDLTTGAATSLFEIDSSFGPVYALSGQTVVPEPSSLVLLGTGLFGIGLMVLRRNTC